MHKEDRLYKLSKGSDTAMWAHDEIVNQDKRIAELEKERIHSVINFLDFCIEKESISKLRMEVAFMHWVKTLKEQGE